MLNVSLRAVALHYLTHGTIHFSQQSVLADVLYYWLAGAGGCRAGCCERTAFAQTPPEQEEPVTPLI